MPVSYQIIPEHSYPHRHVQINDNTEVARTYNTDSSTNAMICVFTSPKGRDGVFTIDTGESGFVREYGDGPFAHYGQPFIQAKIAAASGAATLHCLRVTAEDAAYSTSTLIAKYKVDDETKEVSVKFINSGSDADLTNLDLLEEACTVTDIADDQGYTSVKLFSVAYIGKGTWGKNLRWRIRSDRASDKQNNYKNYAFEVYEYDNGLSLRESHACTFVEDAVYNNSSLYAEDVINDDGDGGSQFLKIKVFPEGFKKIFDVYKTANPDTTYTIEDFDLLCGTDKVTKAAMEKYVIVPEELNPTQDAATPISITTTSGVPLIGGTDGSIALDAEPAARQAALNALYLKAFSGEIDGYIKSKNRFPCTLLLDANYDLATKRQIAALAQIRTDCMAMLDCGLTITTKSSVLSYVEGNLADYVKNRVVTIEPYCMKIRDSYSQKVVTVTSTYWIARTMPVHFENWGGKHKPMAGNTYGIISGYVGNSVYPVFDEDLDQDMMDELADKHINFAKYNPNQQVVRAMQDTTQSELTALSEQNNMLIVLDIKRDAEQLCAQFEYEFSEAEDIARFNSALATITERYADAQVRSISGSFTKSNWEAENKILHLNIEMVHRDLIRSTIIEIDVNRDNQ